MVYSPLIDVIWKSNGSLLSKNCYYTLEKEIYKHLPVHFYGVLLFADRARRVFTAVRTDDHRNFTHFNETLKSIYEDKRYSLLKTTKKDIQPGTLFVAKILDNYYRCQIERVEKNEKVDVYLLDYGVFREVEVKDLWIMCDDNLIPCEFVTYRAMKFTLPDEKNMFLLRLPIYEVFKDELAIQFPVEIVVLSFPSLTKHQPCVAVLGSCFPEKINALKFGCFFSDSPTYWIIKVLRREIKSYGMISQQILSKANMPYPISDFVLSADERTNVIFVHSAGDTGYVRASSLRLAFIEILLNLFFSDSRRRHAYRFAASDLQRHLPCVAVHPETNRYFRASIQWVNGKKTEISVFGVDHPAFKFTMRIETIFRLPLIFFTSPEIYEVKLDEHKLSFINPFEFPLPLNYGLGDAVKMQLKSGFKFEVVVRPVIF